MTSETKITRQMVLTGTRDSLATIDAELKLGDQTVIDHRAQIRVLTANDDDESIRKIRVHRDIIALAKASGGKMEIHEVYLGILKGTLKAGGESDTIGQEEDMQCDVVDELVKKSAEIQDELWEYRARHQALLQSTDPQLFNAEANA